MAKTIITDKAMQARPKAEDAWLIESGARGDGVLVGRISPAGARSFYYRYTGSTGQRVRLPIGGFDPKGDGNVTFTVAQARDKARDLTALYRAGTRDLREHFVQQRRDAELADADARRAAETARREAEEREVAAALQRERRISVRALFDRWVKVELQARVGADGKRIGRKDGGKYTSEQFG
ncbi:MAG: Arm DNA-binding domain-containing protein, partial [Rubrivivax sp.]|nr:Arm DNA-binding domain-containing protein [Rubrivivax sp.]